MTPSHPSPPRTVTVSDSHPGPPGASGLPVRAAAGPAARGARTGPGGGACAVPHRARARIPPAAALASGAPAPALRLAGPPGRPVGRRGPPAGGGVGDCYPARAPGRRSRPFRVGDPLPTVAVVGRAAAGAEGPFPVPSICSIVILSFISVYYLFINFCVLRWKGEGPWRDE